MPVIMFKGLCICEFECGFESAIEFGTMKGILERRIQSVFQENPFGPQTR
jgi:hypothetical protein